MKGLVHDTTLGHIVRFVSRGELLLYPDEEVIFVSHRYKPRNSNSPTNTDVISTKIGADTGSEEGSLVSWYHETDPENPMNWTSWKKGFVTGQICFFNFALYVGSAIYSAGEIDVMASFGVSEVTATLGLTLFVIGYGLGPLLWSPMSEIPRIGRNPVYIWTLATFVVLQIPTALSTNMGMLLTFRFLSGFFASPVFATGGATIADMYKLEKRAYGIAIWGALGVCGPVLGPLMGGFAAQAKGWRWTIWLLMWLSGFTLVVLTCFLPETSSANILHRRAERLRRSTGNIALRSSSDIFVTQMPLGQTILLTVKRGLFLMFQEPIILLLNLYVALVYGVLYVWFESFDLVFRGIYDFNLGEEGLTFIGIFFGAVIAVPLYLGYYKLYIEPQLSQKRQLKPEKWLPPSCIGSFCVPICLFWFGWTARESIHWIVPIAGSSFFAIGIVLLFNPVLNYLGAGWPDYFASVSAGNAFMRSSFGAAFPLFARAMYEKLGTGGASTLLGGISVLFIPIPFLLIRYGEKIRKISNNARNSILDGTYS